MKLQNLCKETEVDCSNCFVCTPAACSTVPYSAQNNDYKVQLLKLHPFFFLLVIIFCAEYHSNICFLQLILSSEKFQLSRKQPKYRCKENSLYLCVNS